MMKSFNQDQSAQLLAILFGGMWLLLMSPYLLKVFHPPKADLCATTEPGYPAANRFVQGIVHYLGRSVVIESGEGKQFSRTFLGGCGKQGCTLVYEQLKTYAGKKITAGFCENTLVAITTLDGVVQYRGSPTTQAELDRKYRRDSLFIVAVYLMVLGLICVSWRKIRQVS